MDSLCSLDMDRIENTSPKSSSVVELRGYRSDRVPLYGHYLATAIVYRVIT
jgi:hypothetical protein